MHPEFSAFIRIFICLFRVKGLDFLNDVVDPDKFGLKIG